VYRLNTGRNPDVSGCSIQFNLIKQINFWFDLILLCGTFDIVISISISIISITGISNIINTQPPSIAEVETVRNCTSTFRLCLHGIYGISLSFIVIIIIIIIIIRIIIRISSTLS
jgi:hypothetical protein